MARTLRTGIVVCALAGLSSCVDLRARGYAGYLQGTLSGTIGLAPASFPGMVSATVDAEDSLGIEEEGAPYARVEAGVGILKVTASGFHYDATGSGTLQADFGDIIAGVPVDTELDLWNAKGAVTVDLLDLGFLRVAPGVAVDYLGIDMTVRSVGLGATERLEVDVPVPMVFAQAEAAVGPVTAVVEAGGMSVDFDDVDGTYFDVEAMLRVTPLPHVELLGGYRWIDVDGSGTASGQEYDLDLTFGGWFVGGGLTF